MCKSIEHNHINRLMSFDVINIVNLLNRSGLKDPFLNLNNKAEHVKTGMEIEPSN